MSSSICIYLRLNGVRTTRITTKPNAFTRITGKTSEELLIFTNTIHRFVKVGSLPLLSQVALKAVRNKTHASTLMVGRSSNIIPKNLKLIHVQSRTVSKD